MKIKFGLGRTIQTVTFENIRPSIEIEDEPQNTGESNTAAEWIYETPKECYERLSELGNRLLDLEVEKINNNLKNLENKEKDEWVNKYNKTMHKEV